MEISSSYISSGISTQQAKKPASEGNEILKQEIEKALKPEEGKNLPYDPQDLVLGGGNKVDAAQEAQKGIAIENRDQGEKRQGKVIDVTV